ncbi:hypothetical protein NECAME_07089 [Necator americanus]|uniref:Uncharacterized protein n=1 Tax=Necator americanus TaxID=51031 RepID=W2TSN4_NECAM|nr:hypothetical protein NECAME_07089 [Necator americanus]ETN84062.1 hypothetical protein NECAME_07089 [Necator americanus]
MFEKMSLGSDIGAMFTERIVILILFAAILVVADQLAKEKMIRSRMRRCARQFSLAMNFQCRGITAEECEPFRELFGEFYSMNRYAWKLQMYRFENI